MLSDETKFLVINNRSDWERGSLKNIIYSEARRGIQLDEAVTYQVENIIDGSKLPFSGKVVCFTAGKCGELVLIAGGYGEGYTGWMYDRLNGEFERNDCIESAICQPSGLSYTRGSLYFSDCSADKRLRAFAEINWQTRWAAAPAVESLIDSPSRGPSFYPGLECEFHPLAVGNDENGNVYAIAPICMENGQVVAGEGEAALLTFDRAGRHVRTTGVKPFRIPAGIKLEEVAGKLHLAVGKGVVYILDCMTGKVFRRVENHEAEVLFTIRNYTPSGMCIDRQGFLYIGSIEEKDDREPTIFKYSPDGKTIENEDILCGMPVSRLTIDEDGRLYAYYSGKTPQEQKIVILKPVMMQKRPDRALLPSGECYAGPFDSSADDTRWHKIILDADIPRNTQVIVHYAVLKDLEHYGGVDFSGLNWSGPVINPEDALISAPAGRYLMLKIRLIGSQAETPVIRGIKVYFPRVSYLRYLPAVYQENEQSRDFLERFLSLFETFNSDLENTIDGITRFFDPGAVDGEFLKWLGIWLALQLDENWESKRLRRLLKSAPKLYQMRSTRRGIKLILKILTGRGVFLVEHFQIKRLEASTKQAVNVLERLYGRDPYRFSVIISQIIKHKESCLLSPVRENERNAVERIIESEKPAHTGASLVVLQPWIILDRHSYLGINSALLEPRLVLDSVSAMECRSLLGDVEGAGQVEKHATAGIDTILT